MLKWQYVCDKKLRLYQVFLLQPSTLLTPAQIKPKSFESRRYSFLYPRRTRLIFTCVLGGYVASSLISTPNLLEGADGSVGGQLRGDKEFPFHWSNQIWQSLEESAVKRCLECGNGSVPGMNGKDRTHSALVNGVTLASVILGLNRSATHIR